MAIIQGTHSGIRSWFEKDEKIQKVEQIVKDDTAIVKARDKINDPWLHGFLFRDYNTTLTKVKKFCKSLFTLGIATYIALLHDLIYMKHETKETDLQNVFNDITASGTGIQGDLSRMDIEWTDGFTTGKVTEEDLDSLTATARQTFKGNEINAALFLRTIGQGASVALIEKFPTQAEELGDGDILLSTGTTTDSAVFDLASKTVTVTYHQKRIYAPTQAELSPEGRYYSPNYSTILGVNIGEFTMTAIFDFEQDQVSYRIEPSTITNETDPTYEDEIDIT